MNTTKKTWVVPKSVANQAKKGLEMRRFFKRGGTRVGINRAKQLAFVGKVDIRDIRSMYSYFARHAVDKQSRGFFSKYRPSNGKIAWLLWGGEAGRKWATKIRNRERRK